MKYMNHAENRFSEWKKDEVLRFGKLEIKVIVQALVSVIEEGIGEPEAVAAITETFHDPHCVFTAVHRLSSSS